MKPNHIIALYIGTAFAFFIMQFACKVPYLTNGALFTSALLAVSVLQDSRVKALSKKSIPTNILAILVIAGAVFAGCFIYYADVSSTYKLLAGVVFLICAGIHLKIKPRRPHKAFSFKRKEDPQEEDPTESEQSDNPSTTTK